MTTPTAKRGTPEYEQDLRTLGDWLLTLNQERRDQGRPEQRLSTSLFHRESPAPLGRLPRIKSREYTRSIYEDLLTLDDKYKGISLQQIERRNRTQEKYFPWEREIITRTLETIVDPSEINAKELHQLCEQATDLINEERSKLGLGKRTYQGVSQQVGVIRTGRRNKFLCIRGSPTAIRNSLEEIVGSQDEEQENEDNKNNDNSGSVTPSDYTPVYQLTDRQILEEVIETTIAKIEVPTLVAEVIDAHSPEGVERREDYHRNAHPGHQNLVAYLLDPVNYKRLFGEGIELIGTDFDARDIRSELFEACKDKLLSIQDVDERDRETVNFTDRWVKCDLVYKTAENGFLVVEVKQHAMNGKWCKNANKAYEQLCAYTAGILGRSRLTNRAHEEEEGFVPLREQVDGYVVTYGIDDFLAKMLSREAGRKSFVIDKEIVDDYITDLIQRKRMEYNAPQITITEPQERTYEKEPQRIEETSELNLVELVQPTLSQNIPKNEMISSVRLGELDWVNLYQDGSLEIIYMGKTGHIYSDTFTSEEIRKCLSYRCKEHSFDVLDHERLSKNIIFFSWILSPK